jgi:hypothetical protein
MLQVDGATLVAEGEKAEAAFDYFFGILGTTHDMVGRLDFEALGIFSRDLSSLGRPFTEEQIWAVVKELPLDKALTGWVHWSLLPFCLVDHQKGYHLCL